MTAARDMSRPAGQHRLSIGANASSLPARAAYSRSNSHALPIGSGNRINRRKSSNFNPTATNPAAIGVAVENAVAEGAVALKRRSSVTKAALASLNDGPAFALSTSPILAPEPELLMSDSAVVDGPALTSFHIQGHDKATLKVRRASDGTHLTKKEKAASGDLKCDFCGKAYKHGSCLTKHLWEHTPQWKYTEKLLISKHQQVQLLEAASVLVAMNVDGSPANDSDNSSSPAASGSSDMHDDDSSSAETTPPPQGETYRDSKRLSNNSSAYSRSFQSIFSAGSMPQSEFVHHRQWSSSSNNRPATGHTSIADSYLDEDPQDLAAAVGLLSCSYGTPKSVPTHLPFDIPPVPPLPAKYQNQSSFSMSKHQESDVAMDDGNDSYYEQDDNDSSDGEFHARHDDMEDGMFGKMDA